MALSYDQLCKTIVNEFYGRFENQGHPETLFAPIETIKEILSRNTLGKLYDSLKAEAVPVPENVEALIEAIEAKMLYEFLAVLLFARCSLGAAKAFLERLVLGPDAKEQTSRAELPHYLPKKLEYLETLFLGNNVDTHNYNDAKMFYHAQHFFCVMVVGRPGIATIKADGTRSLPWIEQKGESLGEGAFGVVSEVCIPPGHYTTDGEFGAFNQKSELVARKSFRHAAKPGQSFLKELRNIEKILRSNSTHSNILTHLAAIVKETPSPEFFLLMPLAEMDLKSYMEEDREMDIAFKASLISSAIGLTDGLDFLHNGMKDDEGQKYIGYHLDLKPANVLLFKDPGPRRTSTSNDGERVLDPSENPDSKHEKMIWKISDFGISKIKSLEKSQKTDLYDLFETNKYEENGASATHNVGGLGEFMAPEADSKRREMDDKSDVWSLGCIISVLFAYMEDGRRGVEEYSQARLKQSKMDVATFWQSNVLFLLSSVDINKEVSSKHASLIAKARTRNAGQEAAAVSYMLRSLENKVLKTKKKARCSAADILDQLRKTLRIYSGEIDGPVPGPDPMVSDRNSSELWVLNHCGLGLKLTSNRHANVAQGLLATDKTVEFDGCAISLNGKSFAYWNVKVILYFYHDATPSDAVAQRTPTDWLKSLPIDRLKRGSTDTSRESNLPSILTPLDRLKPNDAGESWKTVKLTHNHLVAISNTHQASQCYVFSTTGETSLVKFDKVRLPYKHVHFLSVCRDRETLICLLSDNDGNSFLWRAEIGWTERESSHGDSMEWPQLKGKKTFSLDWSATSIISITLQTHDICYIVLQDDDNPRILTIILYDLKLNEYAERRLVLQPLNNSKSRLFNNMDCFHKNSRGSEAIMVTHSARIWHLKSEETRIGLTADRHQGGDEYLLLKIATCQTTRKIFALGSSTGRRDIVLLAIELGRTDVDPEVTRVTKLDGLSKDTSELDLRVLHKENRTAVLVIAVRPENKSCVYRIDLR
ncbi:uncharacterized protein FFB20_11373 [Fusarium fujikuroi]|uniref:non-specific serine/threonine protein kinase n=1 Tax=Fusarium fujikuroi TaxID=5127 RepID=A0A5Q3FLX9_FUSFU|nr:hypothetical protein CEK27_005381 [Fusarium fujikuroi]QGI92308.1 hypothetical protein CEK26_005377 [Fusarium fujikuroi]SCO01189.1 uncharacterized protein FFB20_11373 [Fusarium fujikuroi]SCO16819.1 uncharacterized protein FFE2_13623 [Fusarium fujikuroi]VTT69423.1 unnamed protein product [Fusarium fujikuroi]